MEKIEEKKIDAPVSGGSLSINDFVTPQKVAAFVRCYEHCDEEGTDTETFDDGRLREFFKAYVTPLGDPLPIYLEMMENYGFYMRVSLTGEPALIVKRRV